MRKKVVESHHVATNGPLSDLKPQGSFQVSQFRAN